MFLYIFLVKKIYKNMESIYICKFMPINIAKQLYLQKINAVKNIKYNGYPDFLKDNCL